VTRDRARKKAIRARMAVSGEPYSVAARTLSATEPAIGAEAAREFIVRVNRTMAASSARIEVRVDNEIILAERPERRRPGPAVRLARATWKGIASTRYVTRLRDMFLHYAAEGFIEPATGRYMIDWGGSAEMGIDGKRFSGQSGEPLQPRLQNRRVPAPQVPDEPLGLHAATGRHGRQVHRRRGGTRDTLSGARRPGWPGRTHRLDRRRTHPADRVRGTRIRSVLQRHEEMDD
jgi:hypothetical protein